jgi:hypothetical protein
VYVTPTVRGANCSEETTLVSFATDKKSAKLYSGFTAFGLTAEAMSVDCFFDRMAGKIVRRSVLGPDPANLLPRTKLIWQTGPRHVSSERSRT